ncbi:MAG: histone deacetylase family protein [Paludibacterium sp.]|uniref:histone deacetylase family protein n=1 Tax=Paludibacterium sp. TaxID=1917523 RepID=UPI0025DF9EF0|nr:histone deacetylase family protein [Paludibacterium sp.]MBV8047395.1 histone deacetylase family protein [Paludibacterium sp.]MBV8646856.1 histone deacetylase family protein [Paludibacterium sp.]
MLTIFSPSHRLHHATELKDGHIIPCFEMPSRADTILKRVKDMDLGDVLAPDRYDVSRYTRVHSERYVRFLQNAWIEWLATGSTLDALPLVWPVRELRHDIEPEYIDGKLGFYAMDAGSAITSGTWDAVSASANTALTGMSRIVQNEKVAFALCRPPGHHAGAEYMGGYCFLNNAAIAAQGFLDAGAKKIAVLDVDYHHGNGTQGIFYHRADAMFVSIHGDPKTSYPYFSGHKDELGAGDGYGFNHNLPLPKGTEWDTYGDALDQACKKIAQYAPDALVISLGVDTFKGDPISHFLLESTDFFKIGERLAALNTPTLFVMEGGYMVDDIGVNAVNVLLGFEGRR